MRKLLAICIACFVAAACAWWYGGPEPPPRDPSASYFYDTVTGEVFVASALEIPPIPNPNSPDGNESVRVVFYSCGTCDEDTLFVGYYEKFTEAAKAEKLEQWRKIAAGEMWTDTSGPDQRRGQLISRNGSDWVELYSSEGEAIRFRSEMMGCPDGDGYGSPGECPPLFDEIDSKN